MRVEASHYDFVEWNPKPIKAGTFINKPSRIHKCNIGKQREIALKSPCRIDAGLLDYSALKFTDQNDYKAGEMSFAGSIYTDVNARILYPEIIIRSDRPELVKHYALLVKNATDYKGGFEIEVTAPPYRHIGIGSSSVIANTVAVAINRLLGCPLTDEELRWLVASNFVEESDTDKGKLFPGASTGGTFNTIHRGGFTITSSECEEIFHDSVPNDMKFVIGVPDVKVNGPEQSETDVNCMGWARHNERINAAKSCLWILTEIMPYWKKRDYAKAGEAFYNYTLFGSKALQMLYYRSDLHGILFEQKEAGIEGGFMTSAGPGLVVYSQNPEKIKKAQEIFRDRGCKEVLVVKGDNRGIIQM